MDIENTVLESISEVLSVEKQKLAMGYRLYDVGADSLDIAEIAFALEEAVGVEFDMNDLDHITTDCMMEDIVELVQGKIE